MVDVFKIGDDDINAVVEPNLVLQGLNMILDYNIKKRDA